MPNPNPQASIYITRGKTATPGVIKKHLAEGQVHNAKSCIRLQDVHQITRSATSLAASGKNLAILHGHPSIFEYFSYKNVNFQRTLNFRWNSKHIWKTHGLQEFATEHVILIEKSWNLQYYYFCKNCFGGGWQCFSMRNLLTTIKFVQQIIEMTRLLLHKWFGGRWESFFQK